MKIGVLGGIGPESSAIYYLKLIHALQLNGIIKSNFDFPHILINNIPAPELIHENHKLKDIDPYLKGLKDLEKFGPDFIIMVCNTIHFYYAYLQSKVSVPIVDLREVVKKNIRKNSVYTVFGTSTTIDKGLYEVDHAKHLKITREDVNALKNAIDCFNKGENKNAQIKVVNNLCNTYFEQGSKQIVLGCTELAVMVNRANTLDTISLLVDTTVKMVTQNVKKSNRFK